jgi:hypothetical protein
MPSRTKSAGESTSVRRSPEQCSSDRDDLATGSPDEYRGRPPVLPGTFSLTVIERQDAVR